MLPKLRMIGMWRVPGARVAWPHPRELVDPSWPLAERSCVAAYLRSATSLGGYCGYSWCRFPGGPPDEEMGCAERSDGEWVWPEGLAVYVERYAVRLPEEFLRSVAARGYVPPDIDADVFQYHPHDYDFWDGWVRANRRNRFLALLSRIIRRRKDRRPPIPTVYEIE